MKPEFRQLRLSQLDRNLELARSLPPRPSGGWIASVREALGLSQRQVGKKMRHRDRPSNSSKRPKPRTASRSVPFGELPEPWAATWSTYLYRSLARSRNWRNNPLASEPRVM